MSRIAVIAAGVIVATVVAIVVNLVTSGGAWWLWPILVALVAAAIVVEVVRDRRSNGASDPSQKIKAGLGGTVEGSGQDAEGGGRVRQTISAWGKGQVRNSPQKYRRR